MDLYYNYVMLANAIIIQAAKDYQYALCYFRLYESKSNKAKKKKYSKIISECEEFFNSDDILLYTKISGNTLIELLKKDVIECDYDINKLSKNKKLNKN